MDVHRPTTSPRTQDRSMRVVHIAAVTAALVMATTVVIGLVSAPSGAAGALLDNVWGRVTIVDLYLALGAGWAWISWRERSVGRSLMWAVLLITTGSIALWGYVALASRDARDVIQLLRGGHDIGDVH